MSKIALLWFRQDLRLSDHDAVTWALQEGYQLLPFYHNTTPDHPQWQRGAASQWWLHHALTDLDAQLKEHGTSLILGDPARPVAEQLRGLIADYSVEAVLWNRSYEPAAIARDRAVKESLKEEGILAKSFNSTLLFAPLKVRNQSGSPFRVFTPFWKHLRGKEVPESPQTTLAAENWVSTEPTRSVEELALLPELSWDKGFYQSWKPTRLDGLAALQEFAKHDAAQYPELRDRPDQDGTSRMSPYLHFGQIGAREMLHLLRSSQSSVVEEGITRQLFWREFGAHLLYHYPKTPTHALFEKYELFPWEENEAHLTAWQKGQTGYPIVDAAMRQLWHTGWMHNRCRMIAGSLLVKHLLLPWQAGAEWFWDTLVDADLANNTMGWQWVAGTGADASPYFRIFNPITQGQKFDATGGYVRQWCPELAKLPDKYLHFPSEAPPAVLQEAGVQLGENYPHPLVAHKEGRQRALDAFAVFKERTAT